MECYNFKCKEIDACDKYKKATCLFKVSRSQYKMILQLFNKTPKYCKTCNKNMIPGVLKKARNKINICTECGEIWMD